MKQTQQVIMHEFNAFLTIVSDGLEGERIDREWSGGYLGYFWSNRGRKAKATVSKAVE
jgi:hypothetical protein